MTKEEMKREMALFRFSLIAPVVADTYALEVISEELIMVRGSHKDCPFSLQIFMVKSLMHGIMDLSKKRN